MAEARKTKKDEAPDDDTSIITGDLLEEVAPPDVALQKLLGELDASQARSSVRVEKRERENGVKKWVFLFECGPSEFSITEIQEEYGAGDYRVRVYGPIMEGTERYGILAAPVISIGEPRGKRNTPSAQPAITAQDVAQIVVQTLSQMQPKAPSRMELLEEMRVMRDVLGGNAAPVVTQPAPQKSFMEQAQEMLAFTKMLQGERMPTDEEGNVDSGTLVLTKGMETLQKFLDMAASQRNAVPIMSPSNVPALPNPVKTLSPEEEEMNLLVSSLLAAAKFNMSVESFAKTAHEKLPDEMFDALMNDESWWQVLCAIIPGAVPHQEWFTKLRARIIEIDNEAGAQDANAVPENLTPAHDASIVPQNQNGVAHGAVSSGSKGAGGV